VLSDVLPEDDKARLFYVIEVSEFDGLKVNFFDTCWLVTVWKNKLDSQFIVCEF
jgi:hypothetical protein